MKSLFECVDCIELYVQDLDEGIAYYRDSLGLKLLWRREDTAGLGMENDITEIVLNTQRPGVCVDIKVVSVEAALPAILRAGGHVEVPIFDIDIGKCAVVNDRWGNRYVILDMSKGTYVTDADGNILGVTKQSQLLQKPSSKGKSK